MPWWWACGIMSSTLSIAASGLRASMIRVAGSAANVANARSTGTPEPDPAPPRSPAYRPVDAVQQETAGGGTVAGYRPRMPAFRPEYDPDSPNADANGMVAAPNVEYDSEIVSQIEASLSFKANLAVFRAAARMEESLLDITA
jgi:flagellar basal-body rod protein FlgC